MNNIKQKDTTTITQYTAITQCGSTKYKKNHYIKATISSDSKFEDNLQKLMSCQDIQIDIEYV